jgi:iron complex transport system substrate-binding protein
MTRPTSRQRFASASLVLGLAATLAACGSDDDEGPGSGSGSSDFSLEQTNAWGTTSLDERPTRIAVVSDGDRDIAYALGISPVVEPVWPGSFEGPYVATTKDELGIDEPVTYDATDGTDFEAVAAADPDVILGVNAYSMDEDYEQLSRIAPVITFADVDDATDLTWDERLTRAAEGLGMEDEAQAVIEENRARAAAVGVDHPELVGTSYTYLVVHPEQLSYMSSASAPLNPVDDMGLVRPANAGDFDGNNNAVALENLRDVDADVLLVAYPFGDEGLMSADQLESNELFTSIPAVQAGRWAIVDSENGLAGAFAYPSALSYSWVIDQLEPLLVTAAAGQGGV